MKRRIERWRWRAARALAGAPILRDPTTGDGAFVVVHQGGTLVTFPLAEMTMTTDLPEPRYADGWVSYDFEEYRPPKTTFSAVLAR